MASVRNWCNEVQTQLEFGGPALRISGCRNCPPIWSASTNRAAMVNSAFAKRKTAILRRLLLAKRLVV
uniref:Uncharacterized protein n=1 Tax=Macrostomum lignano TaxID=282301 RepID=A0A1I8I829_9PLAT